jgi:hypothetical protein
MGDDAAPDPNALKGAADVTRRERPGTPTDSAAVTGERSVP